MIINTKKKYYFLLLILMFIGCSSSNDIVKKDIDKAPISESKSGIIGKVILYDKYNFVNNAHVYLYKKISDFPDNPYVFSKPTDAEGNYAIEAVPGQYFIAAIKRKNGAITGVIEKDDCFGYFGGNPIYVLKDKIVNINLNLTQKIAVQEKNIPSKNEKKCGIKGKIMFKGEPLSDAFAYVYKNTANHLKGAVAALSEPTANDGTFTIDVPAGTYYLLAKKRDSKKISVKKKALPFVISGEDAIQQFMFTEEFAGPLASGDYFAFHDENPIKVENGFYTNVVLSCIKKVGDKKKGFKKISDTRIEGIILDKKGNPVEGVFAFAHKGVQVSLDLPNPKYISNQTEKDGKFILNLDGGGLYYIGAKKVLGRVSRFGDLYGYYVSKDNDNALTVKEGEIIKNITIIISPIE
ncbi:hypothetical protein HZA55_08555 [Candidatus Poribacteria bacterium]|nr:hypothetical protein [Candidatus Poribacteria bacterium]